MRAREVFPRPDSRARPGAHARTHGFHPPVPPILPFIQFKNTSGNFPEVLMERGQAMQMVNEPTKRGNMERVFLELARHAEEHVRFADEKTGPYSAEIVPGVKAAWRIVLTHPAHELVAAAHLAARRFGIYVPDLDYKISVHGRASVRRKRMFPGYVFLFVWDARRHKRRIEACPGVQRIMMLGEGFARAPYQLMTEIQHIEWREWLKVHERRQHRGRIKTNATISTKRYFGDNFAELAPRERISLLERALSLPLKPLPEQASAGVGS